MHQSLRTLKLALLALATSLTVNFQSTVAEEKKPTVPVFKDGEAQIVDGFRDPDYWIRHDLWVETEFDSDQNGSPDRVHVSVTRPRQTETEGLKLTRRLRFQPLLRRYRQGGQRVFLGSASGGWR